MICNVHYKSNDLHKNKGVDVLIDDTFEKQPCKKRGLSW